ncbi:Predicted O-methyltransferase YrrM [Flavobacteriaceae bacterium MAR_2010_188]|nr:Predicted O-methyltransferase YrrM [Flavobacteriaceae bacterium MAR_2010_188]
MDFLPKELTDYIEKHSEDEPHLLRELNRETNQKILQPRMLSGHYQGRLLSLLSKLTNPKNILEIGTYTGYSALCLAEGLQKDGELHTIDYNEELSDFQTKYFQRSIYKDQIFQHSGDALEIIPSLDLKFDLVFIDADKQQYPDYFRAIIIKVNPGALIISDNVLWSGKVLEQPKADDLDTMAVLEYNQLLKDDQRIETIILPVRDGLTLSRVKNV